MNSKALTTVLCPPSKQQACGALYIIISSIAKNELCVVQHICSCISKSVNANSVSLQAGRVHIPEDPDPEDRNAHRTTNLIEKRRLLSQNVQHLAATLVVSSRYVLAITKTPSCCVHEILHAVNVRWCCVRDRASLAQW